MGVGFGEGQQKLGYLPYAYSDFLFSTIGEEWGFLGVLAVVSLFALFCWLGFRIAKTAADPFGQYLAVGLTATIGLTAFMHMAVSLGMMPTTGLTLPFMSYGRSSQVISLLGTGILINIGRLRGSPRAAGPREKRWGGEAARPKVATRKSTGGSLTRRPVRRKQSDAGDQGDGDSTGFSTGRSPGRTVLIAGGGTGGHLMPALAIANALQEHAPGIRAGAHRSDSGASSRAFFQRATFGSIYSPPSRSTAGRGGGMLAGRLSPGDCSVRYLPVFENERPSVVVGTGGYASGPVVWWAARHGIPTAIQEQNAYPGLV